MNHQNNPVILITGAGGFTGRAIIEQLNSPDSLFTPQEVRLYGKSTLADDVPADNLKITTITGDIRDGAALNSACQGVDIVIHLASMIDWGTHPVKEVMDINVGGTKNVIDACRQNGVAVLIYTSSVDAIFSGRPILNASTDYPYPAPSKCSAYSKSKAEAEIIIRGANSKNLKTAVLRPGGIYGEHDPYHLPALIKMAQSGFFVKIGTHNSKCMHIYVGNVAHAHLLCAKELYTGNHTPAGNIYHLTDSEPENFFDSLCPVIEAAGLTVNPKNFWIPAWLLYPAALLTELAVLLLRPFINFHPGFSRYAINYITTDFTVDGTDAARDFGFTPKYNKDEAAQRTASWIKASLDSHPEKKDS